MTEIIKWTGGKITKPGIYADVPIEFYHSDCCDGPSASSSNLRQIVNESPGAYWDRSYLNPAVKPEDRIDESKALLLGRAVHHLILSQRGFARAFVIQPKTYFHTKEYETKPWSNGATDCKKWNREQREAGLSILTENDVETIKGMAKTLARDVLVKEGLLNGLVEHSIFWKDKKTGIWLKIRPDTIPVLPVHTGGASADVTDLKTILGVDYTDMHRSLEDNAYYQQCGLIREGFREVLNADISTFTLMFIEKTRPFFARPMFVKDADMDLGDEANRVGLDVMARCIISGEWPGPGRGPGREMIEYLGLTDAARDRISARLQRLRDTFELKEEKRR